MTTSSSKRRLPGSRARALGVALLLTSSAAAAAEEAGLPAIECVRMMRDARIASMRGDPARELEKLRQAFDACPGEIAPIYGLLRFHRERREPGEQHRELLSRLTGRLRDPEVRLPAGILQYLLRDPEAEEGALVAILDHVERQMAAPAEPDPVLARIEFQVLRRLGRAEEAMAVLERLWRRTGADDLVWPLLRLYSEVGRWQDAADLIAPRVAEDVALRLQYILVLGKLGRYREVVQQAESLAPGRAPEGADADVEAINRTWIHPLLHEVAWDLRDRGQDAEAEELFRRLLAETPGHPDLLATVLHLYASEEERRAHATTLDEGWRAETDPNALFEEGTQRLTAGDAAGAIDLLRRAAPEFPELEAAWYNLGMAAYRLEDWATVESAFERAGRLNPERGAAFFFRGIALEKLGRCGDAVGALERAAELEPDRALAHYYLATCYRELGDQVAAARALERYQATKPD